MYHKDIPWWDKEVDKTVNLNDAIRIVYVFVGGYNNTLHFDNIVYLKSCDEES